MPQNGRLKRPFDRDMVPFPVSQPDTRQAILDAAEELFGARGFEGTSLRELTSRAGVNLAAVSYHFGSKEGLAQAALARRFDPINRERLRRLDALEAASDAGANLEPREIMKAFLEPVLEAGGCTDPSGMCRMFGRIMAEQPPFLMGFLHERFGPIARRFVAALRRAVPGLHERDVLWRLHFTIGALAHTLQNSVTLRDFTNGMCETTDLDDIAERLVGFATAGMTSRTAPRVPKDARG
jgi:AcrR family transcriptional regulator